MSSPAGLETLIEALYAICPDAEFLVTQQKPWRSITFAGTELCLSANIAAENHLDVAAKFAGLLSEHDFQLGDELVADIAVVDSVTGHGKTRLIIHALLLES
jgi:hypothetical protein